MFRDVAVVLDERFQHLFKGSARLEKLAEGCRWAEGPAYFPAGDGAAIGGEGNP